MKTGGELKALRKKLKLTQQELAEKIGVAKNTIYDWEREAYFPEGQNLIKYADALNVSASYLIGETDDPTPYIVKRTFEDIRATAQKNAKDISSLKNYAKNESNGSHIEDVVMVPVVSDKIISACCGNGSPFANDVQWDMEDKPYPVPSSLVSGYTWMGCQFRIMTANGSSMEPYIHTGDKVLFATPYEVGPGDIAVLFRA